MPDLVSQQIEKQFNLDCIDQRRRRIFQDTGDLVLNPNALGPEFIAHFKAQWAGKNESELKRCLSKNFPNSSLHFIAAGHLSQQSMIYLMRQEGREYLIKSSAYLGLPDAVFLNHFLMQSMAEHHPAISVPQSRLLFLESGEPIQVMEKMSGKILRQTFNENPPVVYREQIMRKLAITLASIHAIRGNQFGPISLSELVEKREKTGFHKTCYDYLLLNFERHLDCCIRQFRITKQMAIDILKLFETHQDLFKSSQTVLLHSDFVKNNLLIHQTGIISVLDWEDAIVGDPLLELASLSLAYVATDFNVLFRAYAQASNRQFTHIDQMTLYLYRLRFYASKLMFNDSFQQKTKSSPKANKFVVLYQQTRDALSKR